MAKNVKLIRYGLLAVIVLSASAAWWPFGGNAAPRGSGDDSVSILVANHYIPPFTVVKKKMVTVRHFPRAYVPPGPLHTVREILDEGQRELFISAVAIPEGQPITRTIVEELGKSRGMASTLPAGKVAVSFAVDPVRGAGGWVEPGDTIAIFDTSLETDHGQSLRKTRLLFSSMSVLAVGKKRLGLARPEPSAESPMIDAIEEMEQRAIVINVLANPPEAARLIEARERGQLSVVLRSFGDDASWVGQ